MRTNQPYKSSHFHLNNQKDGRKSLATALELDPKLLEDMQQKYPFIKDEVKKVKATKVRKKN